MKRSLSSSAGNTPTHLPSTKHARTSAGGGGAGGGAGSAAARKGPKQLSISAFLCAPAPPPPQQQQHHPQPLTLPTPATKETPNTHRSIVSNGSSMDLDASGGRTGLQHQGLDSVTQHAFEAFKLGTPADEVARPCAQEPLDDKTDEAHLLASALSRPSSAESSEDGFKLFCSQTYQRQSSQVTDPGSSFGPEDSEDDEQQHLSWSAKGSFSQRNSLFAPWIETESHGLPTQPAPPNAPTNFSDFSFLDSQDEQPLTQPMEERTNPDDETCCLASIKPNAGATHAATPELVPTQVNASCSTAEVAHEENTHGQAHVDAPVFNIFRPAKDRKCLLIVRHGESEYNRACSESKSYADPQIFDPQLTARGHHQCLDLKRRLKQIISEKAPKFGDPLFVVSPLTRTLQTFLESNPFPERLASSASYDAAQPPLNIEVLPAISEFMVTPGDVGRPPSHLAQDFPQLAEQLMQLPEVWWYQDPRQPNCALNQSWGSSEPQKVREHRISEFARWLNGRSEQLVVLVGHSSFWHHFTNKSRQRLQNCEVMSMTW